MVIFGCQITIGLLTVLTYSWNNATATENELKYTELLCLSAGTIGSLEEGRDCLGNGRTGQGW